MKCIHVKKNGMTCRAEAMSESSMCYFHNPDVEGKRKLTQSKGGRNNRTIKSFDLSINQNIKAEDVITIICRTMIELSLGKISPKTANTINGLSKSLLVAIKASEYEKRLEDIETSLKVLKERGQLP